MKKKHKPISVRYNTRTKEKIAKVARITGLSQSEVMRRAMDIGVELVVETSIKQMSKG